MILRWRKDIDHISLVLAALGSIRPSAREALYHPACTALCSVVGVCLAATSGNLLVSLAGFLFIPMNNWLAGIFFGLLASMGGWLQFLACVWGFVHFALDAVDLTPHPSAVDRLLFYVSERQRR